MAEIKAGDNGTILELPVLDGGVKVPLNNASVDVVFITGERRFTKAAAITDATNGICEVTLTREDVATPGRYELQGIVRLPGDKEFASDIQKFIVGARK
jgi:hypothetical protein